MSRLTSLIDRSEFPPGHVFFRQGEEGRVAYYVESGSVEVSRTVGDRDIPLDVIGAGRFFGEIALLDGGERVATVTAVEQTVCIEITKEQLDSRIQGADPLLRILLQMLCSYIRSNAQRMT